MGTQIKNIKLHIVTDIKVVTDIKCPTYHTKIYITMPKCERNKVVSLTETRKKGYERKVDLVSLIQKCCDEYASIYVFSVGNMRNQKMKGVRQKWLTSRFFFGKNKVMALGLGKTKENEYKENLHLIAKRLTGENVLMFTNEAEEDIVKWFNTYTEDEYARPGNIAPETVILPSGELDENTYPQSMEPNLRGLGLPTTLVKGVVHLTQDFTVCKSGDTLTPEQCTILKRFYFQLVQFKLELKCVWHSSGTFEDLTKMENI